MDTEAKGAHHADTGGKPALWTASNVFSVLAMGIGSVGYGYSANVIAPILGRFAQSLDSPHLLKRQKLSRASMIIFIWRPGAMGRPFWQP